MKTISSRIFQQTQACDQLLSITISQKKKVRFCCGDYSKTIKFIVFLLFLLISGKPDNK